LGRLEPLTAAGSRPAEPASAGGSPRWTALCRRPRVAHTVTSSDACQRGVRHSRIALAVAFLALALAGGAGAANIPTANVVLTLEPNGVVDVLENVMIASPSQYVAAQEVSMRTGELFAQPSVVVDDKPLHSAAAATLDTFVVSRGTRGVRVSWLQPAGVRTVRLGYRLALLATAYDDVVDLDAPLWEKDWPGTVSTLTGVLYLPRRSLGTVRAWVEGSYAGGTLSHSQSDVRVRLRDVPAKHGVRLHVVFPRTVLTGTEGAVVVRGPGLAKVLAARNKTATSRWWWVLAGAVLLVSLAAALHTRRSHRRARR